MSQEKKNRCWGYEIRIETDTDFKEKTIRDFIEHTLSATKEEMEDAFARTKFSFRHLQEGEI